MGAGRKAPQQREQTRQTSQGRGQKPKASKQNKAGATKERSPVERAVVWGCIGVMIVIVMFELGARVSYSRALTPIQDQFEEATRHEPLKLETVIEIVGQGRPPVQSTTKSGTAEIQVYTWRWFSFFKKYAISVYVHEREGIESVWEVKTGAEAE